MKKALIALLIILLSGIILTQTAEVLWGNEEMFVSHQPKEVSYGSLEPYSLRIIRQEQTLNSVYTLLVSCDIEPNYGYAIYYPHSMIFDKKKIKVVWLKEGIELTTDMGTKIVISKELFLGSR